MDSRLKPSQEVCPDLSMAQTSLAFGVAALLATLPLCRNAQGNKSAQASNEAEITNAVRPVLGDKVSRTKGLREIVSSWGMQSSNALAVDLMAAGLGLAVGPSRHYCENFFEVTGPDSAVASSVTGRNAPAGSSQAW